MKKFFVNNLIIAAFAVSAAMISCNKDKEDGEEKGLLKVTVENGSQYNSLITDVSLNATDASNRSYDERDSDTPFFFWGIADGIYSNGGFSIKLPDNVISKYLEAFDFPGTNVTVSDKNTRFTSDVWLSGQDGKGVLGNRLGKFRCENKEKGIISTLYYVDRDVTVNGTETVDKYGDFTYKASYSLDLKNGWNFVYLSYEESSDGKTGTHKYTTVDPGGMKWYFEKD